MSQETVAKLRQVCPDLVEEALIKGRRRETKQRGDSEAMEETWEEIVAKIEHEVGSRHSVDNRSGEVFAADRAMDAEWVALPFLDDGRYAELFDAAESFVHLLSSWRETVVTGAVFAFVEARLQSVSAWIRRGSAETQRAWTVVGGEGAQRGAFR